MRPCATGRWLLASAGLAAVGLGAVLFRPAPAAAPPRTESVAAPADAGFAAWRGVSSCTSSACHNQDSSRGDRAGGFARGSEYAVWFARDPHARAYQILFDDKSVGIQERLHPSASGPQREAHNNILCLRCHVAPEAVAAVDAAPVWFSDGVGCESCHGAAAGWLAAHVGPGWRQTSAAEKKALGFQDTKDLAVRAKMCMDCHVGGDRAEVNHDLYAAGHPPLQFEFSSALDRYRPYQHWSEADDRRRNPAYEAEAWAVGQATAARAALKLLAWRARGAKDAADPKPWPEFAEYDCTSCHHGLEAESPKAPVGHKAGVPAWSWYTSMTALLPDQGDPELHTRLVKQRDELRDAMEDRNPNSDDVRAKAEALAGAFGEWLRRRACQADADALHGRLMRLTGPEGEETVRGGWEEARQLSFGISAYFRSLHALESCGPDADAASRACRASDGLRAPERFNPDSVADELQAIHHRMNRH